MGGDSEKSREIFVISKLSLFGNDGFSHVLSIGKLASVLTPPATVFNQDFSPWYRDFYAGL
jgi:hypothetical protein